VVFGVIREGVRRGCIGVVIRSTQWGHRPELQCLAVLGVEGPLSLVNRLYHYLCFDPHVPYLIVTYAIEMPQLKIILNPLRISVSVDPTLQAPGNRAVPTRKLYMKQCSNWTGTS
jgi:hypothetical protein